MSQDDCRLDRRGFLKGTAVGLGAATVGASKLGAVQQEGAAAEKPAVKPEDLIWRSKVPTMEYRRLGRTNYMASRVVHGWGGDIAMWRRLLQKGVNYFDCALGYGNYEVELKDFLARFQDKLWITSKATDVAGFRKMDEDVEKLYRKAMKDFIGEDSGDLLKLHNEAVKKQKESGEKPDLRPAGKRMAQMYSQKLDESLGRMGIGQVDAYFMHGIEIPWFFDCLEVWEAFEKAKKAGKAKHFGYSVHKHHKPVLAASVEAGKRGPWKIDVIMPGVNPGSFDELKPELAALKKQDVGIIAMKTSGIKNRPVDGREQKFKSLVDGKEFSEYERAKLWMLNLTEDLVDGVIAGMKSTEEMEKDTALASLKLSAAARRELRALVKYELSGTCHLCGNCEMHCPEHIAVTDMIRYHAYIHQYNEKEMARELYKLAGYDPARVCNNCGKCADVCEEDIPITRYLMELSQALA